MSEDVIDNDTLEAVRAWWKTDNEVLPKLIPLGPQTGRLKSPAPMPYCVVACEASKRELSGSAPGAAWMDFRKVTFEVRGQKADVVAALAGINAIFNRQDTALVYPSGARFLRWWPTNPGGLKQDESTKENLDIWIGTHEAEVWSIRDV